MMKKLLLSAFVMLAVASFTFAQNTEANKSTDTNGPVLSLTSNTIDYGTIERNSEPLRKVAFTNTGNEPLIIKSARGNCGCTVPKWPKEPILPGETKELEVRYATNRVGKFSKKVTLTTNETTGIPHVIKVTGEVLKPAEDEGVPAGQKNILNK
jgi:hypothetical protein